MSVFEILFMPGAFIGLCILRISCKLGIDINSMCLFDRGSATSTGEHLFVRLGNVIFYGVVIILIAVCIIKKVKNVSLLKNRIIFTICFGTTLCWFSLFLSVKKILNHQDIYKPYATGGFPLKAFEYPYPPMGGNWPPADSWPPFFINFLFWLFFGFVVSLFLRKKLEDKKVINFLLISASFFFLLGVFYVRLIFD